MRRILGTLVIAASLAASACSAPSGPPSGSTRATVAKPTVLASPESILHRAAFAGLVVTLETTTADKVVDGGQHFDAMDGLAPGKVRLTTIVQAVNSTGATMSVHWRRNIPVVRDAQRRVLDWGNGPASLYSSGAVGAAAHYMTPPQPPQADALLPGGTLTAVTFYQVTPGQIGFTLTWDLSGVDATRVAKFQIP